MRTFGLLACALLATSLFAQSDDLHRNNITVGGGPAIPSSSYLSTAPLVMVSYGYRFNRLFQADAGFEAAFGAANNQNAEATNFGPVQGGDHEFMIPMGGRVIIPSRFKRMEFSAGVGAVYLHYSETVPNNGLVATGCYSCTSRGGWGGYWLVNASYFLDENHNFHVGTTYQFIDGTTNGQAVGNVPSFETNDRWSNLIFEFGLSF